jgi:hypothetical protein
VEDRPARPWLLALVLVLITGGVAVALLAIVAAYAARTRRAARSHLQQRPPR